MRVSNKILRAISHSRDTTNKYLCVAEKDTAIVRAIINALWTEYDPDDASTWPKPSLKKDYYVKGTDKLTRHWFPAIPLVCDSLWKEAGVTHYLDPNDLLDVRSETNEKP